MVIIESTGITDVGRKRKGNEDAMYLDSDINLFIVADGMGGHQAGEVASKLVVDTMRDYLKRFENNADAEEMEGYDETLSKGANRLLSSIHLANLGVHRVSQTKETYRGMGSTVSAVLFTDEGLIAANVGDSPIYLVHNETIERLSVPHTVMAEHAALNPYGAVQLGKEYRHMLTRAIGVEETVEPDIFEVPVFKGNIIVISSDGLSDKVPPDEILEIVKRDNPEKACRELIDLANNRGGDDNITVIIAKVKKMPVKGSFLELLASVRDDWVNLFKKIFK